MGDTNKMIVVYFDQEFSKNPDKDNVLRCIFGDVNLTSGGEIEHLNFNPKCNQAFIYFKETDVAKRVANKRNITIGKYKFNVKLNNRTQSLSRDRQSNERNYDDSKEARMIPTYLNKRPIIIDGNNVGITHGRSKVFSSRGLKIAIDYFNARGHLDIMVVLPRFRRSIKDLEVPTMDHEILDELEKKGQLQYVSNKVYDDEVILEFAIRKNAVIISNDLYRDLNHNPRIANYLRNYNALEYQLSGNLFFIPDNPFGRNGPTLDEVLTVKEDKIESKIAAVVDATEDLKRLNFENKKNVPKKDTLNTKSRDKDETLLKVDEVKMLFLMIEKKIAIALHSVPFSSEYLEKHKKEVKNFPSLEHIELGFISKTREVLIKVNSKDLDEVKLLINSIISPEKLLSLDIISNETPDLYVLTLPNLKSVNYWLADESAASKVKSSCNLISNYGPYSKEIVEMYKKSVACAKEEIKPAVDAKNVVALKKKDIFENNFVLLKHSYLYYYLKENHSSVEEKFKVKLQFLGVEKKTIDLKKISSQSSFLASNNVDSDSDDDSDDSNISNQSQTPNKKKDRKTERISFKIAIITRSIKQFYNCKNHILALNRNLKIKYIQNDDKNKHFEYLIKRKINELKKEEDSSESNGNEDDDDIENLIISYCKKANKIALFLTCLNGKNIKKINEILKNLDILKKEINFKPSLINILKKKRPEFESNFNVKVFINYEKKTVEIFSLKLDKDDLEQVCESIENLEEENKNKMVTIRPSKEYIAYKYLDLKDMIDSHLKQINVYLELDKRGFFILKSKNSKNLEDAANKVKEKLRQIELLLEYEYRKFPINMFNFIKNAPWFKAVCSKNNVAIKIPPKLIKPLVCIKNKIANLKLFICRDNIVCANTSTIVNSVNVNLLNNGGVAKAIEDAAGQAYKDECERLDKPIDASKVYLTTSGNLNCQSILNVVPSAYSSYLDTAHLVPKYQMCIDEASGNNYESIAFPLLGAGIFGWPIELSLNALLECINNYAFFKKIKEIYLIEYDSSAFGEIIKMAEKNLNKFSNLSFEYNLSNTFKSQSKPLLQTESGTKWYWIDDSNQWKEYRENISKQISLQKLKNNNLFEMNIDGQTYKFDLIQKLQVNSKTGHKRRILDQVPTESYYQWYWIEDGNKKQAYGRSDNEQIENAYIQKQSNLQLNIKRHRDDLDNIYHIDFSKMIQINVKTSFKREIRREKYETPVKVVCESNEDEDDEGSYSDELDQIMTYKIWFVGMRANLNAALQEIDNKLNGLSCSDKIENQNLNELDEKELKRNGFRETNRQCWNKNGVEIKQNENAIELIGKIKKDVCQVKEEMFRMFLSKNKIVYPSYWDLSKNKSDKYCEVIDITRGSVEWQQIESEFKVTLPNNQITGIQRIQNTRIYKYYYEEKIYLQKKNKKSKVNEIFLWHGTRTVSPSKIFSSDKCGLDSHHSAEGMWGRGIYLAKNASYSYRYSHTLSDGSKQFFYCSALVGDSVKLAENNSLRLPPVKDESSGDRYDSIEGFTVGSQIFIVYDNQKVYPAYLITYK